jgi:hypothetical protein
MLADQTRANVVSNLSEELYYPRGLTINRKPALSNKLYYVWQSLHISCFLALENALKQQPE